MLISLEGTYGSGKSLFMTYLAYKSPRIVYANYKLEIPNCHSLTPESLFYLKDEPTLIALDEAYTWLESRASGRDLNKYMSYILFQSRKRNMDILIADQLIGTIDVRFRLMRDFAIHCRKDIDYFEFIVYKLDNYKKYKPKKLRMPYSFAEKLFPIYNTGELINPIDKNLLFSISQNKEEQLKEIDDIASALINISPENFKITKGIVADYCLRNNYPSRYVNPVYNRIKAKDLNY